MVATGAVAAPRASTAPVDGMRDASSRVHALVGARIVVSPEQTLEKGTIIVRDGRIEAVGADLTPPADARVWDLTGKVLYPGFIESEATVFLPAGLKSAPPRSASEGKPAPTPEPIAGASAWNARVTPERDAASELVPDVKAVEGLRALGFTTAHVAPARGIFRGQGAVVSLGDGDFRTTVIRGGVSQSVAFEHGGGVRAYPTSLMGSIALVRQTLLDAQWYAEAQARFTAAPTGAERPESNSALAALAPVVSGAQTVLFDLADELEAGRSAKLAHEFKLTFAFAGTGYDYRVLPTIVAAGVPVIVPLDFPEAPVIDDPVAARDVPLHTLEHWELAPTNAGRLFAAGVPVLLTSNGLKKPDTQFWSHVRQAVRQGLPESAALAALTQEPAKLFGLTATRGSLAAGHVADVVVASGDLFTSDEAVIEAVWVEGEVFEMDNARQLDVRGTWQPTWVGTETGPTEIVISGRGATKLKATAGEKSAVVSPSNDAVVVLAPGAWFGLEAGTVSLSAKLVDGQLIDGTGIQPDGSALRWRAVRGEASAVEKTTEKPEESKSKPVDALIANAAKYPAGAYGREGLPAQPAALLIKNATVWTSAAAGVLEQTDVLIEKGLISKIGRGLVAPADAEVIDGTGKHVTAGIIDCHSHTAIVGGVNESSHSVTIEVRVADAIDATDINIYRQLAGGKTTSNVLHGSANAMGGQNQVIKYRWGGTPDDMLFQGAMPGVKFALGENVTRKNFGGPTPRYPVTRMGVREVMVDTFARAQDYERAWAAYRSDPTQGSLPRRDLQLEAALEMLHGDRLIHIHSYRQDEVLMFIRLAQELHLTVGTFQHILEGYKVADQIAAIGAGGSTFSDWWSYKAEVIDAIPQNGPLMTLAGVVVSFNSDDDELARRLNTDAAKALKFGNMTPAEALDYVTINPAKQLRIDDRVGSLEPGKDADFVIWSGSPLSTMTRAEQTWIDGRRYFSLAEDAALAAAAESERAQLVQKILPERRKALGGGGDDPPSGGNAPPKPAHDHHDHQDTGLYFTGVRVDDCNDAEEVSL